MMIQTNSISSEVSLAEFYVVGYRQRRVLEVLTSGNYSRLCADILFSRQEILRSGAILELQKNVLLAGPWVTTSSRCTCRAV